MSEIRHLVGEALSEIVETAISGGPRLSVGLMATGSEHGAENWHKPVFWLRDSILTLKL